MTEMGERRGSMMGSPLLNAQQTRSSVLRRKMLRRKMLRNKMELLTSSSSDDELLAESKPQPQPQPERADSAKESEMESVYTKADRVDATVGLREPELVVPALELKAMELPHEELSPPPSPPKREPSPSAPTTPPRRAGTWAPLRGYATMAARGTRPRARRRPPVGF